MKSSYISLLTTVSLLLLSGLNEAKADVDDAQTDVKYLGTMSCTKYLPPTVEGARLFRLCDGKTKVIIAVDGVKPGEPMPRETAQKVASTMLVAYEELKTSKLLAHKGTSHTPRDEKTFQSEVDRMIKKGYGL
ncbi:MAG: hypothetical protein ACYSTQ_05515, partial [Planctomycetota bacterium]